MTFSMYKLQFLTPPTPLSISLWKGGRSIIEAIWYLLALIHCFVGHGFLREEYLPVSLLLINLGDTNLIHRVIHPMDGIGICLGKSVYPAKVNTKEDLSLRLGL